MQRILRLPARIALVVGAGVLLVALGVTLLLVNTVKLHGKAKAALSRAAGADGTFTDRPRGEGTGGEGPAQLWTDRAVDSRNGESSSHSAKNPPTTSSR